MTVFKATLSDDKIIDILNTVYINIDNVLYIEKEKLPYKAIHGRTHEYHVTFTDNKILRILESPEELFAFEKRVN